MSHYAEQYDKLWEGLCPPSFPSVHTGVKVRTPEVSTQEEEGYINTTEVLVTRNTVLNCTDLPQELQAFLGNSAMYTTKTALAGGAIRDLVNGENVSDWDLFTQMQYDAAVSFLRNHPDVELNSLTQVTGGVSGPEYTGNIRYVLEFYVLGLDEKVQLIGVDDVHKHIKTEFPLGASRCSYDGHMFRYTMSFARDMHNKTFTVMNANSLTQKYINKLKRKYEWEWRV